MRIEEVDIKIRLSLKELRYFAFLTKSSIGQQAVLGWFSVVPAPLLALIFLCFGHARRMNAAPAPRSLRLCCKCFATQLINLQLCRRIVMHCVHHEAFELSRKAFRGPAQCSEQHCALCNLTSPTTLLYSDCMHEKGVLLRFLNECPLQITWQKHNINVFQVVPIRQF